MFERIELDSSSIANLIEELPASHAVFMLHGEAGAEPYVAKTSNLKRRLHRLLSPDSAASRRLNLSNFVRRIDFAQTGSDFESTLIHYKTLRTTSPGYAKRLKLRFAPFIRMHLSNPYPRASVTTKLRVSGLSQYYGPFPSRADAEKFLADALDFFKMRRCVENLRPDPQFPGCVYSEMKMCLAPCFKGCTDQDYKNEVERVGTFLNSRGQSLVAEISAARDQASLDLDFEAASTQHARLAKVQDLLRTLPDIARPIAALAGVVVQPGFAASTASLFPISGGLIGEAISFPAQSSDTENRQSVESRLQSLPLRDPHFPHADDLELCEHIALLKRWYFRSRRTGELVLANLDGVFSYRRLSNAIGRVLAGSQAS